MKSHGINPTPECPLYSEYVPDFAALETITFPSAHTILLLVADSQFITRDVITRIAERFLAAGLIQVCVWGPDCMRVHDIFDAVHAGDGITIPSFTLMSTWHSKDTLERAIWYFIESAFPLDDEIETTSYVAVTVGDKNWAGAVDYSLSDLPALKFRMLGDDSE